MAYDPNTPDPPAPEEMPQYKATIAKLKAGAGFLDVAATQPHYPSVTEQLGMARAVLLGELRQIEEALEEAKKNEGAMKLIDSIAKTRDGSRL
jgi:hypothetical protein